MNSRGIMHHSRFAVDGGRLDRRITLLSPIETRDAGGGINTTWLNAGNVWASYSGREGLEEQSASQELGIALADFRIRYNTTVTAKWRLLFRSMVFEIIAPPIEQGRAQFTDIVARSLNPSDSTMISASFKAFTVDLAQGDTSKAVTYPTAFTAAPSAVNVSLITPVGGFIFGVSANDPSRTASGFTCDIAATVPGSGYKLSVIAVL